MNLTENGVAGAPAPVIVMPRPGEDLIIQDTVIRGTDGVAPGQPGGAAELRGSPAEQSEEAPPQPMRIEQADHVALIQAQGRNLTAVQAVELAQLRLQLAQRELAAAEAERAAIAKIIRDKYAVGDSDQIAVDGAIWRAQG